MTAGITKTARQNFASKKLQSLHKEAGFAFALAEKKAKGLPLTQEEQIFHDRACEHAAKTKNKKTLGDTQIKTFKHWRESVGA